MLFSWKNPTTWQPLTHLSKSILSQASNLPPILTKNYDGVLAYHACRPTDVKAYYRDGLRVANHEILNEIARNIFRTNEFPEITDQLFQDAVAKASDIDNLRSYLSLDDQDFLTDSGHYLIYGSEHICGIAANLMQSSAPDYRQVLKRFGQPTVFKLFLRFELIEERDLNELCIVLSKNTEIAKRGKTLPPIDFTFSIKQNLPAESIIGHYHPNKIEDPLLSMEYIYKERNHD